MRMKNNLKKINPMSNFSGIGSNLNNDILTGITLGIIALPLALAFGQISQLGPISGIIGAICGGIFGALFGGCKFSVSGPTAPSANQISALLGVFVVGASNQPDLMSIFSIIILSGIVMIFLSLLNISHLIHFIPYSVVAGFMCGIGILVVIGQLNSFFGLEKTFNTFVNISTYLSSLNNNVLFVGLPSLFLMFFWPKIKFFVKIPSPLITLIFGTSISLFFNFDLPTVGDQFNSSINNEIFKLYIPDFSRISEFIFPSITLAGLIIIDSLLTCMIADNLTETKHVSDREVFGQGIANIFSGLLGGVSIATATMFTVSNIKFGGKTIIPSVIYGLTLFGILIGFKSVVAVIPTTCISAILIKVGFDILDYRILPILKKLPILDLFIFGIVLFITIKYNLMIAVFIGVMIALIGSIKDLKNIIQNQTNHKSVPFFKSKFAPKEDTKMVKSQKSQINVLQLKGALFFGSTKSLMSFLISLPKHAILIIDLEDVPRIDLTGIYALEDFVRNEEKKGNQVLVVNAQRGVKNLLKKLNFIKMNERDIYFESTQSIRKYIQNKILF